METKMILIDEEKLSAANEVIRSVSHPLRLRIIDFIDKNKVINVNKIYNTLGLEQSITSQHLRILRLSNLVNTKREGKQIFYSINYDNMEDLVKSIKKFLLNS
jgi:ArsR family transcriptional regulator